MNYSTGEMTVDSALIGAVVSIALQGLKLLPEKWVLAIFGTDKETRKLRMQAAVFGAIFCTVLARAGSMGMIQWGSLYQVAGMIALALATSYTSYQGIIKTLADKFPDRFAV